MGLHRELPRIEQEDIFDRAFLAMQTAVGQAQDSREDHVCAVVRAADHAIVAAQDARMGMIQKLRKVKSEKLRKVKRDWYLLRADEARDTRNDALEFLEKAWASQGITNSELIQRLDGVLPTLRGGHEGLTPLAEFLVVYPNPQAREVGLAKCEELIGDYDRMLAELRPLRFTADWIEKATATARFMQQERTSLATVLEIVTNKRGSADGPAGPQLVGMAVPQAETVIPAWVEAFHDSSPEPHIVRLRTSGGVKADGERIAIFTDEAYVISRPWQSINFICVRAFPVWCLEIGAMMELSDGDSFERRVVLRVPAPAIFGEATNGDRLLQLLRERASVRVVESTPSEPNGAILWPELPRLS